MDGFAAFRLALGLGFLSYASLSDVRTRRCSDWVWIVMGALALLILETELILDGSSWEHQLLLLPTAIIFFAVFFGEEMWTEEGFRLKPLRLALFIISVVILGFVVYHFWTARGDDVGSFWAHLSMPALLILAHVFYQFGLLRGGADAKAFMAIALLVPAAPRLEDGLPLVQLSQSAQQAIDVMFPFALVVLLDAALLVVFLPLALVVLNAARGDAHGAEALLGYRVKLDRLPKFTWLMDKVENGEHVRVLFPRRSENREEQVRLLREKGVDCVWVTPQIPFLLPMTIGFAAALTIGNFVVGVVSLLA